MQLNWHKGVQHKQIKIYQTKRMLYRFAWFQTGQPPRPASLPDPSSHRKTKYKTKHKTRHMTKHIDKTPETSHWLNAQRQSRHMIWFTILRVRFILAENHNMQVDVQIWGFWCPDLRLYKYESDNYVLLLNRVANTPSCRALSWIFVCFGPLWQERLATKRQHVHIIRLLLFCLCSKLLN